jgi:hypothetical protein
VQEEHTRQLAEHKERTRRWQEGANGRARLSDTLSERTWLARKLLDVGERVWAQVLYYTPSRPPLDPL